MEHHLMPKTDMDKPNPFGIFTGGNMGELGRKSPKMIEIRGDPHGENRQNGRKWERLPTDLEDNPGLRTIPYPEICNIRKKNTS